MPILHDMGERPDWCELEAFSISTIALGNQEWRITHPANKLVVVEGVCRIDLDKASHNVGRGESVDVVAGEYLIRSQKGATVVMLSGHWGDDCGGAGIFEVAQSEDAEDMGDPVTYPKNTGFDRHYHDCDEYWIIVTGRGTVSSEDKLYQVGPGDCVATRMGHHHDFPLADNPISAVYFETTMRGEKRRGHLWEHTHGLD